MKNRAPSVVFLAFLSAFPASAQTNTFPASGNADIGTTSPVATLDIVSGQTITGTRLLSGNSSQYTAFVVGRTSTANDVSLGVAGTTGNWNPGSAAGDAALQIAGGKLFLSTGYRNDFVINGSGNIGVATSSPLASLDIGQRTDAVVLPVGTTGQRPSGGNLTNGEIRYNSSLPAVEAYVNGSWI